MSFGQNWRAVSPMARLTLIVGVVLAIATVGYVCVTVWQTLQAKWVVQIEHAPLVINSRPPELFQPIICDAKEGLHTGNIHTFIKNVGNGRALNVNPYRMSMKVVPAIKTGIAIIDDPPHVDCNVKQTNHDIALNLAPGQETGATIRQSGWNSAMLSEGPAYEVFFVSCIDYSDEYGNDHATCDTFLLSFQSSEPLDALTGLPTFICDRTPKVAKFFGAATGNCQK